MDRTVLKIFGSVGPAGSFITLTEKLVRIIFPEAYNLGDPAQQVGAEHREKSQAEREQFVHELFDQRGAIERKFAAPKEEVQEEGYSMLGDICANAIKNIYEIERNRLARERMYRTKGSISYRKNIEETKSIMGTTTDNIVKMACAIVVGTLEDRLKEQLESILQIDIDMDSDDEENKKDSGRVAHGTGSIA